MGAVVETDEDRCCGAGHCAMVAPEVFSQRDEDGVVVVLQPEPGPELLDAVREAATTCPTMAISVRD
ncbi:ferredoxin [Kribbella deserti]|uniref:Ferredoxin n=1 Tax=Kribbella deserti TaxID=1926257 RepID=A0ABV6QLR9_9ACTN